MNFKPFAKAISDNVSMMMRLQQVFKVPLEKGTLKEVYNNAFPLGTNNILVERREHDCTCCNSFLNELGGLVLIDENFNLVSIWHIPDTVGIDPTYRLVADKLDKFIKATTLDLVPYLRNKKYGSLVGAVSTHDAKRNVDWNHFHGEVHQNCLVDSVGEAQGNVLTGWATLSSSIEETSLEALDLVLELMEEKQLDKSSEFQPKVEVFKSVCNQLTSQITSLTATQKKRRLNRLAHQAPFNFKSSVIGTLVVDIAQGVELEVAVAKYHTKVSPGNFKRSSKVITASMKKAALETFESLGYSDSLSRRLATVEDVSVNNMLYVNRDTATRMQGSLDDLLSDVGPETVKKPGTNVIPIDIGSFISDVIPTSTEVAMYVEPRFKPNLVSLIAPEVVDSKPLLKWGNNFSWSFTGDVTSKSIIAQNVEAAGGKLEGALRFSLIWNTELKDTRNDLDIHAVIYAKGKKVDKIYFSEKHGRKNLGALDVDNTIPGDKVAVENIVFKNLKDLNDLTIKLVIHNFSGTNLGGFSAEVVFEGETHTFDYPRSLKGEVTVAKVVIKDNKFTLTSKLPSDIKHEDLWGITSGTFAKVSAITKSPNFWDNQSVGTEHLFFMLDQCINPNKARGLYSEFIHNDLYQHRALLEVIGSRLKCKETDNQLSGLGFSVEDSSTLLMQVTTTTTKRTYKVQL